LRLRSLSSAPCRKNKILHCVLSRSCPPPSRCLIARNRLQVGEPARGVSFV
jgi:hypothetical protein